MRNIKVSSEYSPQFQEDVKLVFKSFTNPQYSFQHNSVHCNAILHQLHVTISQIITSYFQHKEEQLKQLVEEVLADFATSSQELTVSFYSHSIEKPIGLKICSKFTEGDVVITHNPDTTNTDNELPKLYQAYKDASQTLDFGISISIKNLDDSVKYSITTDTYDENVCTWVQNQTIFQYLLNI